MSARAINPRGRLAEAMALWSSGKRAQGERVCLAQVKAFPSDLDAARLLSEMYATASTEGGAAIRAEAAIDACHRVAELAPRDAANYRRLAQLLSQCGRLSEAVPILERALALEPDNARALNNLGNALSGLGRPEQAIAWLERAIALQPNYAIAHNNLGIAQARLGRAEQAVQSYRQALAHQHAFPEAWVNLASVLAGLHRAAEALECHDRADALRAPAPGHLMQQAELLLSLSRPAEALSRFDSALRAGLPRAALGRIRALLGLDQADLALRECEALAAELTPLSGVLGLRAHALFKLKRFGDARTAAFAALQAEPGDTEGFLALGFSALAIGSAVEALSAFDAALAVQPALAKAHAGRGAALVAAGRTDQAVDAYANAVTLNPTDFGTLMHAGHLLLALGRLGNAHAAFSAAVALKPDNFAAQESHAMTLVGLNRHAEALPQLALLRRMAPQLDYLSGYELHSRLQCCDWRDFDDSSADINERVARGERADPPFSFMAHSTSPALQRRCAEIYVADKIAIERRPPSKRRTASSRLRIGYVSTDFRNHPVAQLMAPVFETHDRERFEVFAFSAGVADDSDSRRRIVAASEHFIEVAGMTYPALAATMAELGIDIAIDLGGHTAGSRTAVFAHRPAPIQINFLGYPGTSGTDFIDYILGDAQVIPEALKPLYSEQVLHMPDTYFPCDAAPALLNVPTRREAGLPPGGIVYCCFNSAYKILPPIFGAWMRILNAVPEAVLWLRRPADAAMRNLGYEAARYGVDPQRLIFAPQTAMFEEHCARLSLADIFLDTSPYNAHTTARDALGAAVPVITMPGNTFASRVALSLLHAAGLPELATESLEHYGRLAIELAQAPAALAGLKVRLREARSSAALFDMRRYCRNLEAAYSAVWQRHPGGAAA